MSINLKARVGVEWINNFHSDHCTQHNLSYCDDQANGFYVFMAYFGHTPVFDWSDDNAWETDFRHPDFGGGGDSPNWSDDVHFCFFDDHGGNWDNILHLSFSNPHNQCSSSSDTWRLGCKKLKWFVSCGCETVLNTNADHIVAVWAGPMQGVHLVLGYIGDSHDSWWTDDLGSDFAWGICGGDSIAGSWVDCAYSWWLGDASIAIAAGESEEDAVNRREHETLNWRDFDVSSTNWLAWKWRR